VEVICYLLLAYFLALLLRVVMSWFPLQPDGVGAQFYGLTMTLTEPVLGPLRRVLPPLRLGTVALDLSPIVLFFGLRILMGLLGCG
jgi:YggT family protein